MRSEHTRFLRLASPQFLAQAFDSTLLARIVLIAGARADVREYFTHGDGSLYQRESDGRWVACVDLGVDLAGVRRRKEFSAGTKKEASEKRAAWIKSGALARHRRVIEAATVAEVAKMWLDYLEDQGRKRATIAGYKCMDTVHVASSFLAAIRVDMVVREHVERLYRDLAAKGLSMRMRQAIHVVLNGIFKNAIERELIARSPMERIKRPGGSKQARVKPHHRVRVWTEEEVRKFLGVAKGTQYGALFEVALATGLRPGELYALRWGDIDLYRGTPSVRETLVECEGEVTFETPKTEQSRRTIKLAKTTVATVTAIGKPGRNDLVFATQLGAPCDRNNVRRSLRALARKAGLEERTPHELRHTHASLLLARGTPIKVVSERLGHRDVTTTLEVSASTPGMGERAAEEIDAMLAA